MDKLKYIRVQQQDGTYSDDIPIAADAENISMRNGNTLQNTIGSLDVDSADDITTQLSNLTTTTNQLNQQKVNHTDLSNYIDTQLASDVTQWLNTNVTPTGSTVMVDSSLSISGAAADAKIVGEQIENNSWKKFLDEYNFPLKMIKKLENYYANGSINNRIDQYPTEGYILRVYEIPKNINKIYSPKITLNSLTCVTDVNGYILSKGASSIENLPNNAKYIYISYSSVLPSDDLLYIQNNTNKYGIESFLFNKKYNKYYSELLENPLVISYSNITDNNGTIIQTIDDLSQTVFDFTSVDYGKLTSFFNNSNKVVINLTLAYDGNINANVRPMYKNTTWHNVSTSMQKVINNGTNSYSFTIDCASLIQYEDANQFAIWFSADSTGNATITITNYNVLYHENNISDYDYYNENFVQLLENIFVALDNNKNTSLSMNLRNANGEKYGLTVNNNNQLELFKYIPNKMLILGNSLVFGFSHGDEYFGMAATQAENDFANQLIAYIQSYNSNLIVNKLYISPFQHAETLSTATDFISNNNSYFTNDLDLVIIELGDNVNTQTKRNVFIESFPQLLQTIKTNCPKARILIVGIWFNNAIVYNILTNNAKKYGCELVDIRNIRSNQTQGELNATVYFKDGTTTTVTEARVTHPGNLGMQKIAEKIEQILDF